MFKWLYRRDNIDFITIMIKCLDSENALGSYPTTDETVGVGVGIQDNRGMSKNEAENSS
jgi:hypothetical protein